MTTRRKLITGAVGASALAAAVRMADRQGLIPPDHTGFYGLGETLTYAAQRALMSHHSMAREFNRSQITKTFPINGNPPQTDTYQRLLHGKFADWHLTVDGLVARPSLFSLAELKRYPSRTHITQQACEEGWSVIVEYTGVPLATILSAAGISSKAKYVVFQPFDTNWDSLDLPDAFHPQTLLAYGMNGEDIPTPHGAPLRLRVPRQLGYKSVKYLSRITVTDDLKSFGSGKGSISPDLGYSWYAGI